MRYATVFVFLLLGLLVVASGAQASSASVNPPSARLRGHNPAILAPIEMEARAIEPANTAPSGPITPIHVLSSALDGESVEEPAVTVNQDTHAATQNEPAIAVDPNNPNRMTTSPAPGRARSKASLAARWATGIRAATIRTTEARPGVALRRIQGISEPWSPV
jgi:hypothetical protein